VVVATPSILAIVVVVVANDPVVIVVVRPKTRLARVDVILLPVESITSPYWVQYRPRCRHQEEEA